MFKRSLEPVVMEMLDAFRVVYLTGPRQCGKTTLARKIASSRNMQFINLDDRTTREAARVDPHGLVRSFKTPVVIDEFQYVPDLVRAIKEVSDTLAPNDRGRFLLTGSADIFKTAAVGEALPGHMARLELYPLSLSELNKSTGNAVDLLIDSPEQIAPSPPMHRKELAQIVLEGGYPEPRLHSKRAKRLWYQSYVEGRLLKDFETLHNARGDYVSKLQALVPYLSGRTGNLLKYASVANDLDLNDGLVRNYIEILELMFIFDRVPSWSKNTSKRQTSRMPKLHIVDTGLACHLLGLREPNQLLTSQFFGALYESLVFGELKKQSSWSEKPVELFHFRDKRQHEVDIVVEQDDGAIIGVEAKASATVSSEDFKGLKKLAEFSGKRFSAGFVVYTGERLLSFKQDGMLLWAVPFRALFSSN
ncbi:ATP-binding protein [Microvenator marinus]|uniref:ATP-binding protein n=1 Tax=Microvenator marinus TaxID=2600177 RepID=A0A5B8XX34_9DELT|nr:ATP-binding protein [Microvenator marinus]QED30014.1 ATP-binding protein [Microvenator marinus]